MKLLLISGKKGAGKDTLGRFLQEHASALFPARCVKRGWGLSRSQPPVVRIYKFAAPIKDYCRDVLGFTDHQLEGASKEEQCHIKWGALPHYMELSGEACRRYLRGEDVVPPLADEFMTAREVMQHVGEQIMQRMDPDCLTRALQRRLVREWEEVDLGVVTDPRKPNQVKLIQQLGGKCVRLTRDPYAGQDQHISETALDNDNFPWENFDHVLHNADLSGGNTCERLLTTLNHWGWLHPVVTRGAMSRFMRMHAEQLAY